MRTTHYLKVFLIFLVLVTTACKKGDNGTDGAPGTKGEQGTKGDIGPVGPAGKDGSIMYAGDAAPAAATGKAGDYYLNRVTGQLFGPKTASGWGTAIGLKGSAGTNGTNGTNGKDGANGKDGTNGTDGKNGTNGKDGSKTLSGNGAPAAALGAAGDFYLDKTNYHLYGPKAAAWGPALELKGKDGNANVRSYLFTNPWDLTIQSNESVLFILRSQSGAFTYTKQELTDNLVQVYVRMKQVNVWFPGNGTMDFVSIRSNFYIYPDGPGVYWLAGRSDGAMFTLDDLKTQVNNDLQIKVFVITATNNSVISQLKPGSPALKAVLKPYLEN